MNDFNLFGEENDSFSLHQRVIIVRSTMVETCGIRNEASVHGMLDRFFVNCSSHLPWKEE